MAKKQLTLDQRIKMLTSPCKTKQELDNFIQYFFGLRLPNHTVSRYADTNPLDMIWRVYDICVNSHNPNNIQEVLYVAGRGSGKTLGMAILELLVILHNERDVCHVGAVLAQAKRCYEYQVKFMLSEPMKSILNPLELKADDRILQKMNMEKSHFHIGKEHVTLEVLPCTMKACLVGTMPVRSFINNVWIETSMDQIKARDEIESPQGKIEVLEVKKKQAECLRVDFEDGTFIEGTLDHEIWTTIGWVELQNLTEQHEVLRNEDL